jgi:hypothetical protein
VLSLLHGLTHHLPTLRLDGVCRLLALELGCLLLLGRIDLHLPSVNLGLITAIVQRSSERVASSGTSCVDARVDLRSKRLGLGFLLGLGFGHVSLLSELLKHLTSAVV